VQHFAQKFVPRLKILGIAVESGGDIEFVPDAVFEQREMPTGYDRPRLVAEFESAKALLGHLPAAVAPIEGVPRPVELGPSPSELSGHFGEGDDDRLRAIMSRKPQQLRPADWHAIAAEFGDGKTVAQLRHRWENYAKPGLDTSPLSLEERRQAATLAIDNPGKWSYIAKQLGNGHCRSRVMVQNFAVSFLETLQKLGIAVERGRDIEFVPDEVFEHTIPTLFGPLQMRTRFEAGKAFFGSCC
jgi:hypothetical protein